MRRFSAKVGRDFPCVSATEYHQFAAALRNWGTQSEEERMHCLSYLVIDNFRACRRTSLPLEAYTPLVGQNNTGKSTILEAIQWILKASALKTTDFYDPERSTRFSPVELRKLEKLVIENRDTFLEAWNEHFSG